MKRGSAIADVNSSREAEEEGVVEKNLKPYVCVPGKKENEKPSRLDEEAVMHDLFGFGGMRRAMYAEKKKKMKEKETEEEKHKKKMPRGIKRMTKELRDAWEKYRRQIHRESHGFDIDDFPRKDDEWLNDRCREAFAKFNSLNGNHYEFVKVEKEIARVVAGYDPFITVQARNPDTDTVITFIPRQSRVYIEEGSKLDQGINSDVEAQDVADARDPIDSKLDQGIMSDVEAQGEAAAAGPRRSNRLRALRQRHV